ncbi:hypothetical protein PN498_11910 [Oscillatoria sp. CS-180]|uniref:hypothetical protein n=1 Tax=Oscillatoria sp. CS-180 TaxID=3021720 RepID=UPI00232B7ED8|nr:hypothetical protein [Oscillatoria sp. CS-180]MDB9526698.1 hypothetical protein [Oscillatoria sp. CS-180]
MQAASLLQISLLEPIQETLTKVQEAPMIAMAITICVVLGIVLAFLEKQSKTLSSFLGNLLQIRTQLSDLSTAPKIADLDTQASRVGIAWGDVFEAI